MNYMAEVAKLLGIELNEEFEISKCHHTVKLTENGVEFTGHPGILKEHAESICLHGLLTGYYSVLKNEK